MGRLTFRTCRSCRKMHDVTDWPRECLAAYQTRRSSLPMPYIRADGMDAILNHADGAMYDSKSSYYRAVKNAGCEIVGNDMPDAPSEPKINERELEQDIKTAIEQVEARL